MTVAICPHCGSSMEVPPETAPPSARRGRPSWERDERMTRLDLDNCQSCGTEIPASSPLLLCWPCGDKTGMWSVVTITEENSELLSDGTRAYAGLGGGMCVQIGQVIREWN